VQDDILDIVGDLETLGKEPGSDLREGITTAPVLYALEQHPQLRPMIEVRAYTAA
jgi:geranylgeranyl pyrophosphate synthase